MKDINITNQTNENDQTNQPTGAEYCTMCSNHCSKDALSCGRGRRLFQEENLGQGDEMAQNGAEHDAFRHSEEHGGHGRHGNGSEGRGGRGRRGHSEEGYRERGGCGNRGERRERNRDGMCENFETDMDNLESLMRACGHFLYHSGGERNGQGRIMHILAGREIISQKELQDKLGIQPGSISEILAKMEGKGLIERKKDEEDKRKTNVCITDAGRLHVQEYRKIKGNQDKFAALNEEQKDQLKELLSILLESWK